ncbi:MAG TPA: hypothetical protein VMX13_08195 [Sedimentisphaerales bacterium]|nr:hypothetical protein [Sedimentisphaerales bacterium]
MASHLNAHNMPVADVGESSPAVSGKKWLLVFFGIAAFFVLDRASLLLIPRQYRSVPDMDQYHTLYYSEKIQRFNEIAGQLETVVLGDSRARHGVDPQFFANQSDEKSITAFNFAPASSGIEFTDILVREYLCDLPRLRTIVWGVSPRIFNRYWQDPVCEMFAASQGYNSDRLAADRALSRRGIRAAVRLGTNRMLSGLSATFAHRSKLKSIVLDRLSSKGSKRHFHNEPVIPMNAWGFMELPESEVVDVADRGEVEKILRSVESGRFELDRRRLERFRELIGFLGTRNIRLFCFVPPMHHSLTQSRVADADGTPDEDYGELTAALNGLETQFGNYYFVDLHRGGDNGFTDAEYGDFEHLNRAGSRRLSLMLGEHLNRILEESPRQIPTATAGPITGTTSDVGERASPNSASDIRQATVSDGSDTVPPEIKSHLGKLDYMVGAFPPDNRPLIWAKYEDEGSGIDPASVRLFMDDEDITAKCTITPSKISFKPAKTLKAPKHYIFKVIVSDRAGNKSELVWEILLKPC